MRWLIVWFPFMSIVIQEWPQHAAWIGLVSAIVFGAAIHWFFEWYMPGFTERHKHEVGRKTP